MGLLCAIGGKANSGKDTVALMLSYLLYCKRENADEKWFSYKMYENQCLNKAKGILPCICKNRIHKFATALKRAIGVCIGESESEFESRNFKANEIDWLGGITGRELMQKFASAIRHEVSEDFWIKCCLHKYKDSYTWFISDLRYLNEAQSVKQLNGILIRVNRPGIYSDNHPSETELDNYPYWDYVINNNGTLEDLFEKCKEIVNNLN